MTPAVGCGSRPKWRLEWTPIVGVQQWADNTDRLRRLVAQLAGSDHRTDSNYQDFETG